MHFSVVGMGTWELVIAGLVCLAPLVVGMIVLVVLLGRRVEHGGGSRLLLHASNYMPQLRAPASKKLLARFPFQCSN